MADNLEQFNGNDYSPFNNKNPPVKVQNPGFWPNLRKWLLLLQLFFWQKWRILVNFGALKWPILKRFPLSIGQKGPTFSRALRAQSRRVAFIIPTFFWISAKVAFIDGGGLLLKGLYYYLHVSIRKHLCLKKLVCTRDRNAASRR